MNTTRKFAFVLCVLLLFGYVKTLQATSGACSYHNGVDCNAGQDWDGSVICNDGWKDSSVLFDETLMCKTDNTELKLLSSLAELCTFYPEWISLYKEKYDYYFKKGMDFTLQPLPEMALFNQVNIEKCLSERNDQIDYNSFRKSPTYCWQKENDRVRNSLDSYKIQAEIINQQNDRLYEYKFRESKHEAMMKAVDDTAKLCKSKYQAKIDDSEQKSNYSPQPLSAKKPLGRVERKPEEIITLEKNAATGAEREWQTITKFVITLLQFLFGLR